MEVVEQASWSRQVAAAKATPISLFARNGKLQVTLLELTADRAVASTSKAPPNGSIAVLSRNGARAIATVGRADGGAFALAFDQPLSAWELATIGG